MKLSQLLTQGRVTVSCELFPPKTGAALARVEDVLRDTAALSPDFISVTYGAGGSTSKRTLELAARLQDVYRVPALAHLTCVSSTREEVSDMVGRLRAAGIENILALRGDLPQDSSFPTPAHYHYASELISHIRSLPGGADLCIGAACYPEGHVECPHFTADLDNLKRKVDAGADFLTTQMFFDNDVLYRFLFRPWTRASPCPLWPVSCPSSPWRRSAVPASSRAPLCPPGSRASPTASATTPPPCARPASPTPPSRSWTSSPMAWSTSTSTP